MDLAFYSYLIGTVGIMSQKLAEVFRSRATVSCNMVKYSSSHWKFQYEDEYEYEHLKQLINTHSTNSS